MKLLAATLRRIAPADERWRRRARARLEQLTMPRWALGRLLDLAVDLAGMTRSLRPPTRRRTVVVMAADHGVVAQGVSLYPQEVTPQMVRNFAAGGAGINALARAAGARVVVVDMGVRGDLGDLVRRRRILSRRRGPGTADIARGPAMSRAAAAGCLEAGIALAGRLAGRTDLFATGEMGIGNTTPSAAIVAAVTGAPVARVTGRGTGVGAAALRRKLAAVRRALRVNRPDGADGLDVLAKVGGFEIGGLAGLILGAAAHRRPVLLDGFIAGAAALIAARLSPAAAGYMIAAHRSAEPGHAAALAHLGLDPLLDLGLRLGEGTGAALAFPLVAAAARVMAEVRTFEEAAVSRAGKGS